ncbi:hypothetical protein CERZMDRAFT_50207 [Cercospora zeae-maydis SCOH1-5]|uniref:Rad4 beta-hairpin domain-containing protein n=1 Tax=Cercospora zeae-maydis SCOH1-5 TaxID=717836 RepID=A0A6A6F2C7_9PEZI|nr:hypothetical protein CERZMDRAFT_50207 [Cercospora zeae-maydis SCOH1-5]
MAPSRGKGKAAAAIPTRASRRNANRRAQSQDDVPDVYSDMLREAQAEETSEGNRAQKKRRTTAEQNGCFVSTAEQRAVERSRRSPPPTATLKAPEPGTQTVEDSSESDSNDFEFEDVDIDLPSGLASSSQEGIEDVAISVQAESSAKRSSQVRRKPATAIEKSHRLLVHELHVLCLLGHCMYVNGRCNNTMVQRHLRSLLSTKTISYLNPSQQQTQFQRNRSFMDGLDQAVNAFIAEFQVTRTGLSRPHWSIESELLQTIDSDEDPVDGAAFIKAAQDLEGSQDMANQLFCAMLRAADVDARVVCSIQALPFANPPKPATPKKPAKVRIMAVAPGTDAPPNSLAEHDAAVSTSQAIGKIPSARRRLGQPSFASATSQLAQPRQKTRRVDKLSFPVFWVEAFNEATQKWIAIDPIVTHTTGQPAKLEPPASYDRNQLTYAIAFEHDGSAIDVTWRYAKAYNAKTRRSRVEASANGVTWWKRVMRFFRRPGGPLDRDQVESAEFKQKEAREGLPANVLDFKDHPYYALERHLKRNEVIQPRREVGKVNAGTASKPKMEPVFRRRDVLPCKSADKWYRCGREVKQGEQPLKHVRARQRRKGTPEPGTHSSNNGPTTALYAPYQTQLYVPQPVRKGRIPKNAYGNLDVYVPSMVPAGGVHIRHPLAQAAARLIRVDYADAVTGFQFKGRHGTAVIEGAVVADQYASAVRAVIEGLEQEALEEESRIRSRVALKAWKRFMAGLRIAERVRAYGDQSEDGSHEEDGDQDLFNDQGGGFMVDGADDIGYSGGGFVPEDTFDADHAGGFVAEEAADTNHPGADLEEKHDSDDARTEQTGVLFPDKTAKDDSYKERTCTGDDEAHEEPAMRPSGNIGIGGEQDSDGLESAERPPQHAPSPRGDLGTASDSEKGSMQSHDPEDDELEPDWLESD